MHPNLFTIGPFQLHAYGLFLALGFVAAITLSMRRARQMGENPGFISDLAVWTILTGLVGGRLFYVFLNFNDYRGNLFSIINPVQPDGSFGIGGLVFLGAILTGTAVGIAFVKMKGYSVLKTGDICVPGMAFGYAIGRMGCFMSGCCYGTACDLPWGVTFPADSPAGYYQAALHLGTIHPSQLYMVLGAFITGALLLLLERFKRFDGQLFLLFFIFSGIDRSIQDLFRYYPAAEVHSGYTHNQIVLSALVVICAVILAVKWRRAAPR